MAKILVVEDEQSEQVLMKNALEQLGHHVNFTHDTLNFEQVVDLNKPDLILMDLNLPYRSGIVLIHDLNRVETLRSIPIIVVTATPLNNIRAKLTQLGCVGFVNKPLFPPMLIKTVKHILQSEVVADTRNGCGG